MSGKVKSLEKEPRERRSAGAAFYSLIPAVITAGISE